MMGSKLLKVTGILMIIFGAIAIVVDLIAFAGVGVLVALGAPAGILWAATIFAFLSAVFELVAGIFGVLNWEKPEKATTSIIFGFIVAGLTVLSNILFIVGYPDSFNAFSIVSGLVIPVLYLIGAFQLKKTA